MRPRAVLLLLLLLGAFGGFAVAQPPPPDAAELVVLDAEQQQRFQQLAAELRCLVCQNQSIADSDAPLAADLRAQLRRQLAQGRSDAEIRDYLTARYGDFVLYRPPFKASTWLLWLGPFVLLLVAIVIALRVLRGRRAAAPPPADPGELRRLLADEETRR